jgi:para-nitrobenzyl esterase
VTGLTQPTGAGYARDVPAGSLQDHLARQWPFVWSYSVKGGHLFLSLMADGGRYELEPMR